MHSFFSVLSNIFFRPSINFVWILGLSIGMIAAIASVLLIQPVFSLVDRNSEIIQFQETKKAERIIDEFFSERINRLLLEYFSVEEGLGNNVHEMLLRPMQEDGIAEDFIQIQYVAADGSLIEEIKNTKKDEVTITSFSEHALEKLRNDESRRFVVGDIFYSKNVPYVHIAVSSKENTSGVFVATMNLSTLWEELQGVSQAERDVFYIVDKKGNVVFHERPEDVSLGKSNVLARRVVGRVMREGASVRDFASATGYVNERGERVMTMGIPLPQYTIGVFFERPESVIFAERNLILRSVLLWIVLMGFALFLVIRSLLASRRVVDRLKEEEIKTKVLLGENYLSGQLLVQRDIELTQSNERLRDLDAIKSQFVSVAAHQLRTPLTGIRWTLHALLEEQAGRLNQEQKKFTGDAYKATLRLIDLINDLLDVSRLEEGRFGFKMKRQAIVPLVESSYERFKKIAANKGIKFFLTLPKENVPLLDLDGERIGIVLENLIDNAIKYTSPGGSVRVKVVKEKKRVHIEVIDTGIGVPKGQISRIFTKFFRGENAQLYQTSGTGLGLYLSKNIVSHHNGAMFFTTEEEKGSTFSFWIPIPSVKSANKSKDNKGR